MAEDVAAMGPGGDKLILRGLQFHGFHGVKQEEQTLGQKFVVDIDAWMDLAAAGESDSIADTVSYTDIYRIAKDVVEGMPHNLLESVAHSIAKATLLKFPQISAVRVKVGKPHVAVQGVLDYLGVEIMRLRTKHWLAVLMLSFFWSQPHRLDEDVMAMAMASTGAATALWLMPSFKPSSSRQDENVMATCEMTMVTLGLQACNCPMVDALLQTFFHQ
ncbi:Dihydroneopterin aldolase 1, partial [Dichanthelium oligosanthes]